jgi:hypothetical protein
MAGGVLLVRNLFMPFLTRLGAKLPSLLLLRHPSTGLFLFATALAIFGFATLLWLMRDSVPSCWLVVFAIWVALFCIAGALNPTADLLETGMAPRYSFASNVFLGLAVLLAFSQVRPPKRAALGLLLAGFLISSASDSAYYRFYKAPPSGAPSWTAGVRAWEKDPSTPIQVGGPCTLLQLDARK